VEIINTRLLRHPLNWLIVGMFMMFAMMAFTFVHEHQSAMLSPIPD
jgi:hypothetical protein